MKAFEGVEVWLHSFLISALDGGEQSARQPGRFILGQEVRESPANETGRDPQPVWGLLGGENSFSAAGN